MCRTSARSSWQQRQLRTDVAATGKSRTVHLPCPRQSYVAPARPSQLQSEAAAAGGSGRNVGRSGTAHPDCPSCRQLTLVFEGLTGATQGACQRPSGQLSVLACKLECKTCWGYTCLLLS